MFSESTQLFFLVSSTILVILSMAWYIASILRWQTKPNLIGWALYQIATLCVLLSAFDLDSTPTIVLAFTFAISQFIVILLSLKYGYVKFSRAEWLYFWISLLCLLFWIIITNRPDYLIILDLTEHDADIMLLTVNTCIETMWALAIFTKLYHHPWTEDSTSWLLGWVSWVLALLAVSSLSYENILYPSYLIITNFAIWLLCFRDTQRWRLRRFFEWLFHIVWHGRTSVQDFE